MVLPGCYSMSMDKVFTAKQATRIQAIYAQGEINGATRYDLAMDYLVNGLGWHGPDARKAIINYSYTVTPEGK